MRGSYTQHYLRTSSRTDAVERAREEHREACEQRLAKAMNTGKAANTPWPAEDHLNKSQPPVGQS